MSPPAQSAQRRTRPACGDPEIEQQHAEIDHPNASFGGRFHIFKGIESDILPDGSLDYPENVLRRFDLIIGRIHGQFRRPPDRVINALDKEAFGRWLQGRGRRSMRPSRCSTSQVFVATRLGSLPALGGLCWCGLRRLFRSPGGGLALWLAHLPRMTPALCCNASIRFSSAGAPSAASSSAPPASPLPIRAAPRRNGRRTSPGRSGPAFFEYLLISFDAAESDAGFNLVGAELETRLQHRIAHSRTDIIHPPRPAAKKRTAEFPHLRTEISIGLVLRHGHALFDFNHSSSPP